MIVRKLVSIDEMLGTSEVDDSANKEIAGIEIEKLIPFCNHPFKLYEGERLKDMIASIKELGILLPIIVRPLEGNNYEILSGHNRVNAAKALQLERVPTIIKKDITDQEAILIVTESNIIQRSFSDLLHSERAAVIAVRHRAMSRQGIRTDLFNEIEELMKVDKIRDIATSYPVGKKLTTIGKVGETYNLSPMSIARYLRISKLIKKLLDLVDNEKLPVRAAVDLSYLSDNNQTLLSNILTEYKFKVDMKKSKILRTYSEKEELTVEVIISILSGSINKMKVKERATAFKLNSDLIKRYFTSDTKKSDVEKTIDEALKLYFDLKL
jgi:ParB family transcriptional regulator, chromosome partitioning protein